MTCAADALDRLATRLQLKEKTMTNQAIANALSTLKTLLSTADEPTKQSVRRTINNLLDTTPSPVPAHSDATDPFEAGRRVRQQARVAAHQARVDFETDRKDEASGVDVLDETAWQNHLAKSFFGKEI